MLLGPPPPPGGGGGAVKKLAVEKSKNMGGQRLRAGALVPSAHTARYIVLTSILLYQQLARLLSISLYSILTVYICYCLSREFARKEIGIRKLQYMRNNYCLSYQWVSYHVCTRKHFILFLSIMSNAQWSHPSNRFGGGERFHQLVYAVPSC
jgi:hypothetical protein